MTETPDAAALYLRYSVMLRRVAASLLLEGGRVADVDDVIHEVFTSLLTQPPKEVVRNWEAWLVRAVKNRAYDRLSTAEFRHRGTLPAWDSDDTPTTEEDQQIVEEERDLSLLMGHVRDSLAVLDSRQREVVRRVVEEQVPQGIVATDLNISRPRVNQILKIALEKMRTEMKRKGVDGDRSRS